MPDVGAPPTPPTLDGLTEPLFWRPSRLGVESAWYGHVPFGFWLVGQVRPDVLVELGTHNGVSYCAFCDSVLHHQLATRCYAVDTWQGDQHAGHYDGSVYDNLRNFHDQRYKSFSSLLRTTFDEARDSVADGSIDLLHIDGEHTYTAVRHDFEAWLPKLSARAVVLFHDTNVRERNFGVWQLWLELRQRYPGFEFLHASGLGVLAVGDAVPGPVADLCGLRDDAAITGVRERFAYLGQRWEAEDQMRRMAARIDTEIAHTKEIQAELDAVYRLRWDLDHKLVFEAEARRWLRDQLNTETSTRHRLERELADAAAAHRRAAVEAASQVVTERARAAAELSITAQTLNAALHEAERRTALLRTERDVILNSTMWRATGPLRRLIRLLRRSPPAASPVAVPAPALAIAVPPPAQAAPPPAPIEVSGEPQHDDIETPRGFAVAGAARVVFISGEPTTPGHNYRVLRTTAAATMAGAQASWLTLPSAEARQEDIAAADVIVIWRTPYSPQLARIIETARAAGTRVVYDLDDLMFRPELAKVEVIDGIRSQNFSATETAEFFGRIRDALSEADICTCTTPELAEHIRAHQKPVFVLPNGFDAAGLRAARRAVRRRALADDDGLLRIGYPTGSRTHQKDFAEAAEAVARVLRERPNCRLVLYTAPGSRDPVLIADEFPALRHQAAQIEWREMVPMDQLPDELARFDINIAPLELGNVFCDAKSELKFFEAALAGVATIASPTGPMRRVIRHGETGLLATTPEEWYRALCMLLDDAATRRRMAQAAYLDMLWPFGPERRAELIGSLLHQLAGGQLAATAFELELRRQQSREVRRLALPHHEVVYCHDRLGDAEVSVIIPLHNYAHFIVEALESVKAQTIGPLDLVVVDDASTDDSLAIASAWVERNAERFNRVIVVHNPENVGLGRTRNIGFSAAETPYVLPLDADNRLLPECLRVCLEVIRGSNAAFAYPAIQYFGGATDVIGMAPFEPLRFTGGNYIDAMALVARSAWAAVGGYDHIEHGWEDYDFWCRFLEQGFWGARVPEILAEYRVHEASMLRTTTDLERNKRAVIEQLERRHPWLAIPHPDS